jgi:hypothetical protein
MVGLFKPAPAPPPKDEFLGWFPRSKSKRLLGGFPSSVGQFLESVLLKPVWHKVALV